MFKLLLMIFVSGWLNASALSTLYKYYEKQEYDKGCDYGKKYFSKNSQNEKYATLYALSCLETDNIDRIAQPMLMLNSTKEARENATYFATVLLQKELLIQALLDEKNLGEVHYFPKTSFYLSKLFDLFVAKTYTQTEAIYRFEDTEHPNCYYKLYIETTSKKEQYMIIDIYENEKFTKRYRYR